MKQFQHTFVIDGVQMTASVSPCVWMYPGYPLQVQVQMKGGGSAILKNQNLTWETATQQDVVALAESIRVVPCHRCGKPAFDPSSVETNRQGLCEACFTADIEAEFNRLEEEEEKKVLRRDRKMKKQGYTHRVTGWIHPEQGSDTQAD